MKKRITSLLSISAIAAAAVLPATVQAHGDHSQSLTIGHRIDHIKDSVVGGFQRTYLRVIPGSKSGALVLKQSMDAMENVKSFEMDVKMSGAIKNGAEKLGSAEITMKGPVVAEDMYNPQSIREQLAMTAQVEMQGVQISGAGEMVIDGQEKAYIQFTEIPLPLQQFSQLKNQWLSYGLTPIETSAEDASVQAEHKQAIDELYQKAVVSDAKREYWQGESVFVVDVELPDDAVLAYMEKVSPTTAEDRQEMQEVLGAMSPLASKLWIDQSDFYIVHAESNMSMDMAKINETMSEPEADATVTPVSPLTGFESGVLDIAMVMSFSQYNEPLVITVPEGARPMEEVMQEVMGGLMVPGTMPAQPSTLQTMPARYEYDPAELPEFSDEQLKMLEQYGY
jgi:hypothetical protein